MANKYQISFQTRRNWLIDAFLFSGVLMAAISGVYFLFLPVGGYQGGRNPFYGVTIIFQRETWDLIHTWGGIFMIAAAVIHLTLHWNWVASMTRRIVRQLTGQCKGMNRRSHFNVAIDAVIAVSFLLTAISGIYFLYFPGGPQAKLIISSQILFSRTTWDLIHTWAGIIMIIAAVIHFAIHWQWVTKVTRKIYLGLLNHGISDPKEHQPSAT
jgi:preprotein translocase subunit SecY